MEKDMNKEKLEMLTHDLEITIRDLELINDDFTVMGWNVKNVPARMRELDKVVSRARMRLEILKKECLSPAEEESK